MYYFIRESLTMIAVFEVYILHSVDLESISLAFNIGSKSIRTLCHKLMKSPNTLTLDCKKSIPFCTWVLYNLQFYHNFQFYHCIIHIYCKLSRFQATIWHNFHTEVNVHSCSQQAHL